MTERNFWRIFTDIAKQAGVHGVAPHDLRRTCATEMYNSGRVSLKEISLRLGHSSVAVTEKYLVARNPQYRILKDREEVT